MRPRVREQARPRGSEEQLRGYRVVALSDQLFSVPVS